MEDPESWRWIWLFAAVAFGVGEMSTPGSFFLVPFAIGALVASALAFLDVSLPLEWLAFIVVSVGVLVALRPLARRLDREGPDDGIGSRRLIGQSATVLATIPGGDDLGLVRVNREEWRAESSDGSPIVEGTTVRVAEVRGTRVMVEPVYLTPKEQS